MEKFTKLNIPQEIQNSLVSWYETFETEHCYSTEFFDTFDIIGNDLKHLDIFPKGWYKASWFVMKPGALHKPHLDRTRLCALNLPVIIPENSYTLLGNKESVGAHTRDKGYEYDVKVPLLGEQGTFVFNEDEYDRWDMCQGILLNTKWPHGAYNGSDQSRVIMTFGFTRTYDDVKQDLKDLGWCCLK